MNTNQKDLKFKNNIKYYFDEIKQIYYKVNNDYKKIVKLSKNDLTKVFYFKEIEDIIKLKSVNKKVWINNINLYYRTHRFEWTYKGVKYETIDIPFIEQQLQLNNDPIFIEACPWGKYLGYHNGEVWAVYFGPDLPNVQLFRIDLDGNHTNKWTKVNNVKNFQIIPE